MRRIAALLLLGATAAPAQSPFASRSLGFSMPVPSGFLAEGEDLLAPPGRLRCWVSPGSNERPGWVRLCVDTLDSTLPRKPVPLTDRPGTTPVAFTWMGFEIQGVRTWTDRGRQASTTYEALVPLRTVGLRVTTEAPRESAVAAEDLMIATLASLEGETNWLARDERAGRLGTGIGQLGVIIMAVGIGMWIMQRRMKKQRDA